MKSDKRRIEMRRSQIKRSEVKRSGAKKGFGAKKSSSIMKEMGSQTTSESNYYATNYNDTTE